MLTWQVGLSRQRRRWNLWGCSQGHNSSWHHTVLEAGHRHTEQQLRKKNSGGQRTTVGRLLLLPATKRFQKSMSKCLLPIVLGWKSPVDTRVSLRWLQMPALLLQGRVQGRTLGHLIPFLTCPGCFLSLIFSFLTFFFFALSILEFILWTRLASNREICLPLPPEAGINC